MKRVLIVEDNRLEIKILSSILERYFNDFMYVDYVQEGNTAMQYLSRNAYDLIITDLIMPGMDGIELIRKIKHKSIPAKIFAVTGSNPFYLNFAKVLGVDAVFTKPLEIESFTAKIEHILTIRTKLALQAS